MTEDEMVGWHHRHNGHGFGWTPGVGDGQGVLACCSSWGHKELDMTETELIYMWNLEKWYRGFYLQNRNRDTDAENKCMDSKRVREAGINWEVGIGIYTLLIVCIK